MSSSSLHRDVQQHGAIRTALIISQGGGGAATAQNNLKNYISRYEPPVSISLPGVSGSSSL